MEGINQKYIYSDLTHEIIGAAYEVQNEIGCGHREQAYQLALAKEFKRRGIKYEKEVSADIRYKNESVGVRRLDFMIENKIVVELKVGNHVGRGVFDQINEYLKFTKRKLGLIILFTSQDVKVRRVVNVSNESVYQ